MDVIATEPAALPYCDWYRAMLAMADNLYESETAPPLGMVGRFHAVFDAMRDARAAPADLAQSTRIALTAHRLREAVRSEGKTSSTAAALRSEIRGHTLAWLRDVPLVSFA